MQQRRLRVKHLQMIPKMPPLLQIRRQLQQKIWRLSETRSRSSLENLWEFDLTASQSKCDTADNNQCCYCGDHFSLMAHYFYWKHHFIIFRYVSTWGKCPLQGGYPLSVSRCLPRSWWCPPSPWPCRWSGAHPSASPRPRDNWGQCHQSQCCCWP